MGIKPASFEGMEKCKFIMAQLTIQAFDQGLVAPASSYRTAGRLPCGAAIKRDISHKHVDKDVRLFTLDNDCTHPPAAGSV